MYLKLELGQNVRDEKQCRLAELSSRIGSESEWLLSVLKRIS